MFDHARGEYSIIDMAEQYGVNPKSIDYWILTGRLKTIRKGAYHVIMKDEMERFMQQEIAEESQA